MYLTPARPYGASTGVLSIQMTDRVRDAYALIRTHLTSRARPDGDYKYYLAVAPFPSRTHSPSVGVKVDRPSRACIQLWSLGPSLGAEGSDDDRGEMRCEMVLCIDSGPALELKWCPLPSHDPVCSIHYAISPRSLETHDEVVQSCRGRLPTLRGNLVCSLACSKTAPCRSTWSRTRLTWHPPNRQRQRRIPSSVSHRLNSRTVNRLTFSSEGPRAHPSHRTRRGSFLHPRLGEQRTDSRRAGKRYLISIVWSHNSSAQAISGAIVVYNIGRAVRSPSERELPITW